MLEMKGSSRTSDASSSVWSKEAKNGFLITPSFHGSGSLVHFGSRRVVEEEHNVITVKITMCNPLRMEVM